MIASDKTHTIAAVAAIVLGSSLPLIIALSLLLLLGLKLILAATDRPGARRAHHVLNMIIVPLLIGFAIVVALKLFQGLQ